MKYSAIQGIFICESFLFLFLKNRFSNWNLNQLFFILQVERNVGFAHRKKAGQDLGTFMDRESQIQKIEKTFEDAKIPITKHHSKPNVYPEFEFPIKPDDQMWKFPCAQVIFDSDPAPMGVDPKVQNEMMSQAMIRGVMDESGEQASQNFSSLFDH